MFGIGGTELIVIAIVLLIAVGPNRLPKLLKAAVKGYREFRRATRELRASTGIDEILRDEDLQDLRKPLYVPPAKPAGKGAAGKPAAPAAERKRALGYVERAREDPPEGVDVAEVRDAMHRPSREEGERIRAEKEAVIEAKMTAAKEAPAPEHDEAEHQRIVEAKLAAMEAEALDPERQRVIDQKLAAMEAEAPDPARQRIIDEKLAAAERVGEPEGEG